MNLPTACRVWTRLPLVTTLSVHTIAAQAPCFSPIASVSAPALALTFFAATTADCFLSLAHGSLPAASSHHRFPFSSLLILDGAADGRAVVTLFVCLCSLYTQASPKPRLPGLVLNETGSAGANVGCCGICVLCFGSDDGATRRAKIDAPHARGGMCRLLCLGFASHTLVHVFYGFMLLAELRGVGVWDYVYFPWKEDFSRLICSYSKIRDTF